MPVAQRLGWGARSANLFFWVTPSQKYIRWAFHTPIPKYIQRGTLPSLSHNPTHPQEPKTNYGQLTPKGPTWGCAFCTPILGPWASDTKSKKLESCNFGNPHFGPLGFTCPFLQFWTPENQRTTWTTLNIPIPNLSPTNPPI